MKRQRRADAAKTLRRLLATGGHYAPRGLEKRMIAEGCDPAEVLPAIRFAVSHGTIRFTRVMHLVQR